MIGKRLVAVYLASALLLSVVVIPAAAQNEEDDRSMFEVVTGTTREGEYAEETKDWQKGDFVGFRLSKDAWFYIVYGNEENPNHITMASVQLRYLGGATIQDRDGNTIVDQVGIPVATVYAQALLGLFEFQDEGYTPRNMFGEPTGDTEGAHNNLWDFKRTTNELEDWDDTFIYTEPVIKAAMLNASWTRTDMVETVDEDGYHFEFSLYTEDLEYGDDKGKIWDGEFVNDDTEATKVEKVEFTFYIDISVEDAEITGIPWFNVRVEGKASNLEVLGSESAGTRNFEGRSVHADYKFDHYVEGWDFKDLEKDTKLMLETVSVFGTFVPDIVNEWFTQQYVGEIEDAVGFAEYEYDNAGEVVDAVIGEETTAPDKAHLVQKESISFNDNWRKVGDQSWISDVDVDNETKDAYYQIHAGQNKSGIGDNKDGFYKALIILGGYIYPAGGVIFHDPGFSAVALIIDMNPVLSLFPTAIISLQALIGMVAVVSAGAIGIRRRRSGRRKD